MNRINSDDFEHFSRLAQSLGFTAIGAAPAQPVSCSEQVRAWVDKGYHAQMNWFAANLERRLDPRKVVAGARSVVVLLTPYTPDPVKLGPYRVARYAAGDDYHDVLKQPLRQLCTWIAERYPGAQSRPYSDTGPVLERYWAQQAGLGWIGKNGNLISRTQGSYVFLSVIITDVEMPFGTRHKDYCGSCRACLQACPTDAFPQAGVVDANRCISYWNIELRGDLPRSAQLHNWVFGCDICQEVCPWTHKFSQQPTFQSFLPRPAYRGLDERELIALGLDAFRALFRKSPIKRAKLVGLQRNLKHLRTSHPSAPAVSQIPDP